MAHKTASSIWSVNGSLILLVEDDEDIGSELIQALTSHGYRARLAGGGAEALSAAVAVLSASPASHAAGSRTRAG